VLDVQHLVHFGVIFGFFVRYTEGMERALVKPKIVRRIVLTPRDAMILRAVHRFRFFTTDQAQLLTGAASRNKLNDRLAKLWAHDYLDRPIDLTRATFSHADKRHVVHVLGQRGADWLAENDGVKFPKGKGWRSANADLSNIQNLAHTIGMVLGSSFKCNTQSPLGIGCCDGHTKQAPQQRGTWRDISRA